MNYRISAPEEILEATVKLPQSKSYLARKMIIDAIAGAEPCNPEQPCDDIKVLAAALACGKGEIYIHEIGRAHV